MSKAAIKHRNVGRASRFNKGSTPLAFIKLCENAIKPKQKKFAKAFLTPVKFINMEQRSYLNLDGFLKRSFRVCLPFWAKINSNSKTAIVIDKLYLREYADLDKILSALK